MTRQIFVAELLLAFCGCLTPATFAAGVVYPALGHFDPEEGTIELWLTPMVDDLYPELSQRGYRGHFGLLGMDVPEQFHFRSGWMTRGKQSGVNVSMGRPGRERALLSVIGYSKNDWRTGQPQRLAFTWKQNDMRVYLNGREAGGRQQQETFSGAMGGQSLTVGDADFRDCRILLHAVRISDVARTEPMLASARPAPDRHTRLLDLFDRTDRVRADGQTTPVQFSPLAGASGGRIKGSYHFVSGASSGLALFAERSPAEGKQ